MKRTKSFISLLLAALLTVSVLYCCAFAASAATLYYGDADGDGSVTAADARAVLRVSVKLDTYNAALMYRYDVNGDSVIASDDARLVLRTAVSLEKLKVYTANKPGTGTGSGSNSGSNATDAANAALVQKINKQISYFNDGEFYMEASSVEADGTFTSPMIIACKGKTVYFSSDFDGLAIGILSKGNNLYMINDEHKAYIKLTDANLAIMGIKKSDLSFNMSFDATSVDGLSYTVKTEGSGYIVTFAQNDGSKSVISTDANGTITRLATLDASGATSSDMMIYAIEDTAPEARITVPGSYKQYYGVLLFFTAISA